MGKCIGSYHCLVRLHGYSGDPGNEPAGADYLFCVDSGCRLVEIFARCKVHDDLFHRAIACTLPYAVYRALHLSCPVYNCSKRVCDSQPQIVMTVYRDHSLLAYPLLNCLDQGAEFVRRGVPNRIRYIYCGCTGSENGLYYFQEVSRIGPRSIHWGEFNIFKKAFCKLNHLYRSYQRLFAADPELEFQMYVGSRMECMNTSPGRVLYRLPCAYYVLFFGPCKSGNSCTRHFRSNPLHGLKITR